MALATKQKLSLLLLALVGVVFVLLSTSRYGAGLSPDSVGYISIARNLIAGAGFVRYDGNFPTVVWPPLYPAVLALVGGIFRTDPLLIANILNALVFGLIVYVGGLLTFKHLSSFPAFALVGAFAILFSIPLFSVSVMAWSEPLFILFVLLSFIFADSYLEKNDVTSLILFSSSVALSCLTRYLGVTLILWGALIIVIFRRDSLKKKIATLSLFMLISSIPLGIWLIRNYSVSHTLFGSRTSSPNTLFQILSFVISSLLRWYIPRKIVDHRSILAFVIAGAVLFTGLSLKGSWQSVKIALRQISPAILFAFVYTACLVITSTTTAYDRINDSDRLLSPIFVSLTLLFLVLAQAMVEPYRKSFSKKIVNSFMIIVIAILLAYPIGAVILKVIDLNQMGQGYSSKAWKGSETIQYLIQHQRVKPECTVYTNGPDAAYILAHLAVKKCPARTEYNFPEVANDFSRLSGSWPEESNACIVWFDKIDRKYLLTIDELKAVANIDQIVRLEDGAIYSVTRK